MAARTLYTMMNQAATNPAALRPGAVTTAPAPSPSTQGQTFVDTGIVVGVTTTSVVVQYQGNQEVVKRATDEPVMPGQLAFVSRDRGGNLVLHGSRRNG